MSSEPPTITPGTTSNLNETNNNTTTTPNNQFRESRMI
jgi:hypothetical protein